MPRLPQPLIRQAALHDAHLPALLRVCRDLPSARNELRWLKEHAHSVAISRRFQATDSSKTSRSSNPSQRFLGPNHRKSGYRTHEVEEQEKLPLSYKASRLPIRRHTVLSTRFHRGSPTAGLHKPHHNDSLVHEASHQPSHIPQIRYQRGDTPGAQIDKFRPGQGVTRIYENRLVVLEKYEQQVQEWAADLKERISEVEKSNLDIALEAKSEPANGKAISMQVRKNKVRMKTLGWEERHLGFERRILAKMVSARSAGKPLQYIMRNQPFGNLSIVCQPGVLIPRPETETYTEQVGRLLGEILHHPDHDLTKNIRQRKRLRILDLCTGTGCIALLLHSILKPPPGVNASAHTLPEGIDLEIVGLDISGKAIGLARTNLNYQVKKGDLHQDALKEVKFAQNDVLRSGDLSGKLSLTVHTTENAGYVALFRPRDKSKTADPELSWDLVIANPPYISQRDFGPGGRTERSVARYEPKSALVPPDAEKGETNGGADQFYKPIVHIARALDAQLLVMEVGDTEQADRVLARIRSKLAWSDEDKLFETWRDDGSVRHELLDRSVYSTPDGNCFYDEEGKGASSDRTVVAWRSDWGRWRRQSVRKAREQMPRPSKRKHKPKPKPIAPNVKSHGKQNPESDPN